jgi:hypothetical protein
MATLSENPSACEGGADGLVDAPNQAGINRERNQQRRASLGLYQENRAFFAVGLLT